jgi:predicted amidohydrolase YtcJ
LSIDKRATLLVVNGKVWAAPPQPLTPGGPTALAIAGDRILALGSDADVRRLAGTDSTVVDAGGGLVLPGFNDAHVHFLNGARHLANLELSGETTVDAILRRVAEFAAANPNREWLLGRGWFYAVFPGGMPHRDMLDAVVPGRPVALEAYDSHTTWVNTAALARLAITASTPSPPRGQIQRDPSGVATGILKEAAMELVDRALPTPTQAEDVESLAAAIQRAHRHGLTSVQEAGAALEQFPIYEAFLASGRPRIRIRIGLHMEAGQSISAWKSRLAEYTTFATRYRDHQWISSGIVKAFADGVIESGTAAMLSPYEGADDHQPGARGYPQWDPGELREAVGIADRAGWQVQVHAIGDGAVRMALDAFEHAASASGRRDRRHRVEHIETVDAEDIPRFGSLGVVASMQPYHADPEPAQLDLYTSKIGSERASRGWPWGSIRRTGGRLAFGSDWPIVSFDPFLGLNSAINRTTQDGRPAGGWLPNERLSLAEALAGYTTGSAWAEHAEGQKGALRAGMLADVVVLDRDLSSLALERVVTTGVLATIAGGRLVYHRNTSP